MMLFLFACSAVLGLETLQTVPPDLPFELGADAGTITRASHGQVAIDLPFAKPEAARAHWAAMRERLVAEGWRVDLEGRKGKLDRVVLLGDRGRVELGCCRPRADRQELVFVSWWPPGAEKPAE